MKIKELKTTLTAMIKNQSPVTPMIWGKHGIGKSSIVEQVAKDLGMNCICIMLSQREAVDLLGVLYTKEDKELGISVTDSHPPAWFVTALKKGNLVLFLDEFNLARREVMAASFELVLSKRLNNIQLPDSVFIVCAGNPEDERYNVTPMSDALVDRFLHIKADPDLDSWMDWAKDNVDTSIREFLRSAPNAAYTVDNKDAAFPITIKHSFRSWARVNEVLKLKLADDILLECLQGIVGQDIGLQFVKFLKENLDKPLTAKEMKDLSKAEAKLKEWSTGTDLRMDLISASVENLMESLPKADDFEGIDSFMDYFEKILDMIPEDLAQALDEKVSEKALEQVAEKLEA